MRRFILISLLTYLVFALDSSLGPLLKIAGCRPHIALAALVFVAPRVGGTLGIATAAVWGFVSDCLADRTLGLNLTLFTLSAFGLQHIQPRREVLSPWQAGSATFVIAIADLAAACRVPLLEGSQMADLATVSRYGVGSAAYTACVAVAVALIARLVIKRQRGAASSVPRVANKWRMLAG